MLLHLIVGENADVQQAIGKNRPCTILYLKLHHLTEMWHVTSNWWSITCQNSECQMLRSHCCPFWVCNSRQTWRRKIWYTVVHNRL